ncbi:MAG: hypothetical protein CVT48_05150 [Thermoplasmata archaeon HGW-Thermoplasmata-1]|nr:MAG: hypothetical protein CVT48_05150 [Thermoplasmata archaeon HGW-Thermoplasmata-1]
MIEEIFGSRSKIRIIRAMLKNAEREWCLDDIVRATGLSCGAAHPALGYLSDARIVLKRLVGRTPVYRVNGNHFLMKDIQSLFKSEKNGYTEIARIFSKRLNKEGLVAAILFGSVARGDFTCKSDIDVLLIFDDTTYRNAEIGEISQHILDEYDVNISATLLSFKEAKDRLRKMDPFIINATSEGIILHGDEKWSEM